MKRMFVVAVVGAAAPVACTPKAQTAAKDDFFFSVKKTPCYGQCPVYELNVHADGTVVYNAVRFTEQTGTFTKTLSAARLQELKNAVRQSPFFSWDTLYDNAGISDLPSTIVEISLDGRRKKVVNRHKGPKDFKIWLDKWESLVGKEGYVKKE
ncbi:MAG: DUF6438 domain-containing protein [Bacteroidia bacterium]|nr:DUF6438 domain-containing protein [Bacteroidia bacterium]MDW8335122.1 DUF6438 domain-containing protein [Bacteroidia bacterium]